MTCTRSKHQKFQSGYPYGSSSLLHCRPEYLSAQLAVDDLLIDEIKEQMDYLTQVLNEYRKAGIKPPTPNAQLLLKQIDRYTMLMKDKDQYFSESESTLCYISVFFTKKHIVRLHSAPKRLQIMCFQISKS